MSHAYLLQWNPNIWTVAEFNKWLAVNEWKPGDGWAFASHKQAKIGDRVFIHRTGKDRPGIVGYGTITKIFAPSNGAGAFVHFNHDKVADLNGEPLISEAQLHQLDADQHWGNQASGISINDNAALKLSVLLDAPITIRIDVPQGIRVKINGHTVHAPRKVKRGIGSY